MSARLIRAAGETRLTGAPWCKAGWKGQESASAGLGVGVIWCPAIDPLCDPRVGLVDVIAAEPEAFWTRTARGHCRSMLTEALAHLPQPKLLRGVGAPLGGSAAAPDRRVRSLRDECAALRPVHACEQLGFNHFRPAAGSAPVFTNVPLPLLQSAATAGRAAEAIIRRRASLGGLALAVEPGVNHLPPAPGEWPDGAFIGEVARRADCGIVLDLRTVLSNAQSGRQTVEAFLAALPLDRVWELHIGGSAGPDAGRPGGAAEDAFALAARLVPRLRSLKAMILRPALAQAGGQGLGETAAALERLKVVWARRGQDLAAPSPPQARTEPDCAPALWEELLGAATTGFGTAVAPAAWTAWWHAARPRLALYRRMAREGRASAVAACAPNTARCLLACYGAQRARRMLDSFWRALPASPLAIDEARHFADYLAVRSTMPMPMARAIAVDAYGWGGESSFATACHRANI